MGHGFGVYLDLKTPPVRLPQESPRVPPSYRNPPPKMEGRLKVPCRFQRDKDSRLQGVSQLLAVLISRAQSSAWEPSPCITLPLSQPPALMGPSVQLLGIHEI